MHLFGVVVVVSANYSVFMAKKKRQVKSDPQTAQQLFLHTQQTLQMVCAHMIGPGYFEKLSKQMVVNLVQRRYRSLRMRSVSELRLDKEEMTMLNEIFLEHLVKTEVLSLTGERLELASAMRDGLVLSVIVETALRQGVSIPAAVAGAFAPYFLTEPFFLDLLHEVLGVAYRMGIILSDWGNKVFLHNVYSLAVMRPEGLDNVLAIDFGKPETAYVRVDDKRREVIRVGWANHKGSIDYVYVRGRKTGLTHREDQRKLAVYIQRHALQRLQERLGLLAGMVQEAIYRQFRTGDIRFFKKTGTSLIELRVMEKKLGYLVCVLAEEKVVIRSFLFVTNDGTPEAKKLAELTRLNVLDKKYLGIDTLAGFASFEISKNVQLAAVFTEAGLGELFELEALAKFIKPAVKENGVEYLLNYMRGLEHLQPVTEEMSLQAENIDSL